MMQDDLTKLPLEEQPTRTLNSRIVFLCRERRHFLEEINTIDKEIKGLQDEIESRSNKSGVGVDKEC